MSRKFRETGDSGYTILLVDDNPEYLEATRLVLKREGHRIIAAGSGPEALELAKTNRVDLMLLDYYMPGMTGEETLDALRRFNSHMQVILQTGYASENPPRELLRRLDIQGYFDKSEGPEKLLLWTDVGLKASVATRDLRKRKQGLGYILGVTPELSRIQPLEALLRETLWRVSALLASADRAASGAGDVVEGIDCVPVIDSFLAMPGDDGDSLLVRSGTGRYLADRDLADATLGRERAAFRAVLESGAIDSAEGRTLIPLRAGNLAVGVALLARECPDPIERELLLVFANQAAVAIQNAQLYEMATMDPLTGVFARRFFGQCALRAFKTARRTRKPVGIIMVDMDDMKPINDTAGHLVGDRALIELARVLRDSIRDSDLLGRLGGDEFSILLPDSSAEGVALVAERICSGLEGRSVSYSGGEFSLGASVGIALLEPPESPFAQESARFWQSLADYALNEADGSLYEAKRVGKGRSGPIRFIAWPDSSLDIVTEGTDPSRERDR